MNDENQKIDNTTKNKRKGKIRSIIIGMIVIAATVAVGIWWFIEQSKFVTSDDAYVDAFQVTISAQIPGRIVKLYIQEGDPVQEGQLLAQLDSSDYVARIEEARVNLEQARLGIRLAQVKLEQAKINYDRAVKQYNQKLIPEADFQNQKSVYDLAKVELSLAEKKIKVLNSSLNSLQTTLSHTSIYAPMNGVAAKRWVLEGDVVSPGQGIFTVIGTEETWITLMLPENEIRHIHIGDTANITIDAFPKTTFKGVFYQIGNSTASRFSLIPPNNASGNFTKVAQRVPLKLTVFKTGGESSKPIKLLPGMSAEIKVKIKSK